MGRKPTRWTNLPRGMRARPRGKKIFYYLDTGEKPRREIPLGSDYVLAVQKWGELTSATKPAAAAGTFVHVQEAYWKEVLPTKSPRTQQDNEKEIIWLLKFFGNPPAPLEEIEASHIRQYKTWRVKEARLAEEARNADRVGKGRPALPINPKLGQVRTNRETALFSHMWNFARSEGYTNRPNPCTGIAKFKEAGRDTYVGDELLARLLEHAGPPLRFAVRLAELTGQRPADVRKMSEKHLLDGVMHVRQGKTDSKMRMVIEGEFQALLAEIKAYKTSLGVHAMQLLVNEEGKPLTVSMLRSRFDDAREAAGIAKKDFQFRDLRARAATEADDVDGIRRAQALLGHTTEAMTADYIRHKAGKKVRPLR
jgi:integrase